MSRDRTSGRGEERERACGGRSCRAAALDGDDFESASPLRTSDQKSATHALSFFSACALISASSSSRRARRPVELLMVAGAPGAITAVAMWVVRESEGKAASLWSVAREGVLPRARRRPKGKGWLLGAGCRGRSLARARRVAGYPPTRGVEDRGWAPGARALEASALGGPLRTPNTRRKGDSKHLGLRAFSDRAASASHGHKLTFARSLAHRALRADPSFHPHSPWPRRSPSRRRYARASPRKSMMGTRARAVGKGAARDGRAGSNERGAQIRSAAGAAAARRRRRGTSPGTRSRGTTARAPCLWVGLTSCGSGGGREAADDCGMLGRLPRLPVAARTTTPPPAPHTQPSSPSPLLLADPRSCARPLVAEPEPPPRGRGEQR